MSLCVDNNNNFKGIFFQDEDMRETFKAYPEIVFIDATYKLTELRLPLYLMLVEDSMGNSEVVGVALLVVEDHETMSWFLETFKSENKTSNSIRIFMADKDLNERQLLKELFPNAVILICLFHSLRTFKREVSPTKMGITQAVTETVSSLFQQMAYAGNEEKYLSVREKFLEVAPPQVKSYFEDNWHVIKDEWVLGSRKGNFLNSTNNRLESLNSKIKSVVNLYSSLEAFLERFYTGLLFVFVYFLLPRQIVFKKSLHCFSSVQIHSGTKFL